MAIQFARIRMISRKTGGNACCTAAYNARTKIVDEKTGEIFNFKSRSDNVYHEVMLPKNANKRFKDISVLSNAVEKKETKSNSQLLKEVVIALPDDKEFSLKDKINITHLIIEEMEWLKNGLAVQMDIHKPHDDKRNWHAHLLVQTRRFTECGTELSKKARDLNPVFKTGKGKNFIIPEEDIIHEKGKRIINAYCKKMGYETRVDSIGKLAQEHIGPVRMRSVMNAAVHRNEERKEANIKHLNSGVRVLESVTRHMSVFNRRDLERAVKIVPDSKFREKLLEDALSSKSLISLYDENGKETGYYTTTGIRAEESKLLRLSGYIEGSKNVIPLGGNKSVNIANELIQEADKALSKEQSEALSHLLLGDSGVRILRGRAGTGKSYVLGKVASVANGVGVNVVGLAPTHKARSELAKVGYEQNDTVKGMLFKLNNGRFELPKGSLIVLDEAGMVGNDDYQELLRVAAGRKCNIILSGDEKQLASVQCGGMFEVFADRYGNVSMLNIQRQDEAWGRAVAMAFSNGEVRSGVSILQEKNRIVESVTKDDSMQGLLADWSKSQELIADRLIIAVTNHDVNALNHGARQYLKLSGDLRGAEIAVGGNHYMKGDRILIKETNKDLGLVNGDFATIIHASKERFVIALEDTNKANDNSKLVEFNPSNYGGFRHGYATTVFKAQGASILDVFVFHDGFAGIRNSYVALSRNVRNLRLYINNEATKSIGQLIKQLGHDPEIGSSLSYFSKQDLAGKEIDKRFEKEKGIFSGMVMSAIDFTIDKITAFNDKHFIDNEYYKYTAPELRQEKVEAVLDIVGEEVSLEAIGSSIELEEKIAVGGDIPISSTASILNSKISKAKQSKKERFYAKADYVRRKSSNAGLNNLQQKAQWDMEAERLRSEVKFKTEIIARGLLGEPNKSLSDGRSLRFGEHGKIAVRISGDRMGSWYDFSSDKGGDMFALVQDRQGCDFKGAADYLRKCVGMEVGSNSHLQLVHDHRSRDLTEKYIKAKAEQERIDKAKAEQVEKIYSRARNIGNRSVAFKYLTKTRNIDFSNGVGIDIKTTGIYVGSEQGSDEKGKYLPVIVAFARDSEGNVTGGQQIFLDKNSGTKANIAIPKKSFGKIAGSFVDVGEGNNTGTDKKVTIIAEGLETALSVKQGLSEHSDYIAIRQNIRILCSLGVSNIKNYPTKLGEKIIIAADNDGISSNTSKTIENAKLVLEEKGAFVEIVQPAKEGDFNDVLKSDGVTAIGKAFESTLAKHTATTLEEYFSKDILDIKLDNNDKSNLAYIEKYDLPQSGIVDAYRKNEISGKLELEQVRKGLEMAANHYRDNKEKVDEAKQWGYEGSDADIIRSLIGMDKNESYNHINDLCNNYLETYFASNLSNFSAKKYSLSFEKQKALISKEQNFLCQTFEQATISEDLTEYKGDNRYLLMSGRAISRNPEKLDELFAKCENIKANDIRTERELCVDMAYSRDIDSLVKKASTTIERHNIRTIPAELATMREKAVSVEKVFEAIEKEQNKLADQHGKIKYLTFEKELLEKCELAHNQRENNSLGALKDIANQALGSGAKTEVGLLKDLQQVTDLEETHTKLDKDIEVHHINSTLDNSASQKHEAKSLEEILSIITKEQDFLSGLHVNIKYPEEHNQALLDKCEFAHKQTGEKVLHDLKDIANQSLVSGAKSEKELVSDLQQITDLKAVSKKIDIAIKTNDINEAIKRFDTETVKAKSLDLLMENLEKKQVYLSNIYTKLKDPENMDQAIVDILKKNQQSHAINNIEKLKSLSRRLMSFEHKTENDVFNDLKGTNDLKSACEKIGGKVEGNLIKKNIYVFNNKINNSKTGIEAANILTQRQSYLANIDKQLDYQNELEPKLIANIADAKLDIQENSAAKLFKLTSFVVSEKLYSFDDRKIHNCLKESASISDGLTNIRANYHKAYMKDIVDDLNTIEKKGELHKKGKVYDCSIKYLTENISHSHEEYAPQKDLKELLEKTMEIQNQKEKNGYDFER